MNKLMEIRMHFQGNKEKDKIEEKIRDKKKKLGMKLVDK